MFGLGRKEKINKAIERALASIGEADDDVADYASIEALDKDMQAEAFGRTALELYRDERYLAAKHGLDRALALAPDEFDLNELSATISTELGDVDSAIEALKRLVAARPREVLHLEALADLLIGAERPAEVIELLEPLRRMQDPLLEVKLAEALFVTDRSREALAILDPICAHYDAILKVPSPDWEMFKSRAEDASRLRDDVYAELHGREATIDLHAKAGKLNANAGVNYRLMGARLAAKGEKLADVLELQDPETTERRGRELEKADGESATSNVLVGVAQLRRGELKRAKKSFKRACELDGSNFAAFIGLGATLDHETHAMHRAASRLAMPSTLPPELPKVVADWPALTDAERRVVWASAAPLAGMLSTLAERGVKVRILPIDVRATDVELFGDVAGIRESDDQRSYDAITGVATHGGAIAKIDELLDMSEYGWTFAHEFAHLVFFHLDEPRAAPLLAIHERALEVGYAATEYAMSNADEFFAAAYVDFLRHRYELPGVPHLDDAGVQQDLISYFDDLTRPH